MKIHRRSLILSAITASSAAYLSRVLPLNLFDVFVSKDKIQIKNRSSKREGVVFTMAMKCPEPQPYNEYVAKTSSWIKWPELDQFTIEQLDSENILRLDFEYDGQTATSRMYFENQKAFQQWRHKLDASGFFVFNDASLKYKTTEELKYLIS